MNDTHRANALRVFISGLKKNLTDILFATQPKDLPSALALAQDPTMIGMRSRRNILSPLRIEATDRPNNKGVLARDGLKAVLTNNLGMVSIFHQRVSSSPSEHSCT